MRPACAMSDAADDHNPHRFAQDMKDMKQKSFPELDKYSIDDDLLSVSVQSSSGLSYGTQTRFYVGMDLKSV